MANRLEWRRASCLPQSRSSRPVERKPMVGRVTPCVPPDGGQPTGSGTTLAAGRGLSALPEAGRGPEPSPGALGRDPQRWRWQPAVRVARPRWRSKADGRACAKKSK